MMSFAFPGAAGCLQPVSGWLETRQDPAPKLADTRYIYIALHKSQWLFLHRNIAPPRGAPD
jgi:hypothetical protein